MVTLVLLFPQPLTLHVAISSFQQPASTGTPPACLCLPAQILIIHPGRAPASRTSRNSVNPSERERSQAGGQHPSKSLYLSSLPNTLSGTLIAVRHPRRSLRVLTAGRATAKPVADMYFRQLRQPRRTYARAHRGRHRARGRAQGIITHGSYHCSNCTC
jgi:hypothetical protein